MSVSDDEDPFFIDEDCPGMGFLGSEDNENDYNSEDGYESWIWGIFGWTETDIEK